MKHSDSIAALGAALAKAQGQIEGAKKDSSNPHFKSKYADLASCWDACREALSKNGLAVIQAPGEAAAGVVEMTTMLAHESGEWISERLTIPLAKVDAQGYGSAITYARRYALCAMVGIAPDDDDGNAAVAGRGAANDRPRNGNGRISDDQFTHLQGLMERTGVTAQRFCERYQIQSVRDLPACKFDDAIAALNARAQQREAA